jgi:hypothetical protein
MGNLHEYQYISFIISRSCIFRMLHVSGKNCRKNQNIYITLNILFSQNRAVYEIMCKNFVKLERPEMAILHGECALHDE